MERRPYPWRVLWLNLQRLGCSVVLLVVLVFGVYLAISIGWYLVERLREYMPQ